MKHLFLIFFSLFLLQFTYGQNENFNLSVISNVMYPEGNNDIWGYVDENGIEYAIIGTRTATVVLSLEDPTSPRQILRVDGEQSIWRDMKSWGHYIYSVCDACSDGLVIIDMADPENPVHKFVTTIADSTDGGTETLGAFHNIFVDEHGFLYGCGGDQNNGGVFVMDLNEDPWNPYITGYADPRYSHDIYVRDNIIYSSDVYSGFFSVMDATDKKNINLLATQNTTGLFTHNAWLSDDGNVLFTTDEVDFGYLDAYDISDLNDIKRIDTYRPPSTDAIGVTPHNSHVLNDYVITSWYTDGLKIIDAQYPDNLIEVASYDTWNGQSGGTEGNWGAYPYLPSGLVLVSDIATGLYVMEPTYERASYLEGKVTDGINGSNIPQVKVDILGDRPNLNQTSNFGTYKTGIALTGNFDIKFSHPLYRDTIVNVRLKSDSLTILDMVMEPRFAYINFAGKVLDGNGAGVANATMTLQSNAIDYAFNTDIDGNVLAQIFDLNYSIRAGRWGYGDTMFDVSSLDMNNLEIQLSGTGEYYQDRFVADLGWDIENNAATGSWERGVPRATNFQGPLNPGSDSPNDFGDDCYGTGLVGISPFDQDVDGVYNTLTSPAVTLLGDETSVNLTFDYWYRGVDIGNGLNDSLVLNVLLDGVFSVQILKIDENLSQWNSSETINLLDAFDFFPVTGDLQVAFVIGDDDPGNPLEAAIDYVNISINRMVGTNTQSIESAQINIYPNPVNDLLIIDLNQYQGQIQQIEIFNLTGQKVVSQNQIEGSPQFDFNYPKGLYTVVLTEEDGGRIVKKIIK